MELTVIYVESWMSGSHRQAITQMRYCCLEGSETVVDMLNREGLADNVVYVFEGHVKHYEEKGE